LAVGLLSGGGPAHLAAEQQSSAHYTARGQRSVAAGAAVLGGVEFQSGTSLGQGQAVGPSGATTTSLATQVGGFWAIVAGALPSLDIDGDGQQAFLDPDDDGDGLADPVETGTGVFVSASDTGTDPNVADSDGDGVDDGTEVAFGTDPNDPSSTPAVKIPALPTPALWALAVLVAGIGRRRLARTGGIERWSRR
jgi:hypothetical protein